MHGLVGPSNPLLPASELTLMYFASHLAQTVSYETVKLYLVAVQDLHRELNFPLQLNKMHRLQKVLTGIKRLNPARQLDRFPIILQILHAIHTYFQPEYSQNLDHVMLWRQQLSFLRFRRFVVVYKISCADCCWSYVGETGRCFKTRRKEHQRNLKNYTRGSNIANHAWQNNHSIDFDGATVIDKGNYRIRRTLESWHTAKTVGADNNSKPLPRQYSILL